MLNDKMIARMLAGTACIAVIISVLAISIRVLLDGLGPQLSEMTDALIKIATGGGLLTVLGLLGGKAIEGVQNNNTQVNQKSSLPNGQEAS